MRMEMLAFLTLKRRVTMLTEPKIDLLVLMTKSQMKATSERHRCTLLLK